MRETGCVIFVQGVQMYDVDFLAGFVFVIVLLVSAAQMAWYTHLQTTLTTPIVHQMRESNAHLTKCISSTSQACHNNLQYAAPDQPGI